MNKYAITLFIYTVLPLSGFAQEVIPFDTSHWAIEARAYVLENYKGYDALYLQQGRATLKDEEFRNGTIEFDIYLTERPAFPGIYFRAFDDNNMELFYLRPHQSGNPDANQATPVINGLTGWQLYYGEAYSFPYRYNFEGWTHVKLVVNEDKAQVYLDHARTPHLSWNLKHTPREGKVAIGGGAAPMHYANFKINKDEFEIVDFKVREKEPVEGVIPEWTISDSFREDRLNDPAGLRGLIRERKWENTITVEENSAANISWAAERPGAGGNTVFARITITSDQDQLKLFEFGYSDRVVVVLNGKALYRGNNRWRSRDYRYLGTIGLFDALYLELKKGQNTLLLAVSEDFGGWGLTGRFASGQGIEIRP